MSFLQTMYSRFELHIPLKLLVIRKIEMHKGSEDIDLKLTIEFNFYQNNVMLN